MDSNKSPILFASGNAGKCLEAAHCGERYGYCVLGPRDFIKISKTPLSENLPEVDESESSYIGNARLKAQAYYRWSGIHSIGDDSGLEVSALGGAPGVLSARYAGVGSSSEANIEKLLEALKQVENQRDVRGRSARFVCALVMKNADQDEITVEAYLHGEIVRAARGKGGFGYDSVFLVPEYGKTLAELKEQGVFVKTHRVLALEKLFGLIKTKEHNET